MELPALGGSRVESVLDDFITKASRGGCLVVVCERSERLGGLGPLDERAKFGSLSWCLGWILERFAGLPCGKCVTVGYRFPPGP
jgi:hypothetical protein